MAADPVLPFLVVLEFLVFSPCEEFLVFLSVFPFFSKDFRGSVGIKKILVFSAVFRAMFQRKTRKGRTGEGIKDRMLSWWGLDGRRGNQGQDALLVGLRARSRRCRERSQKTSKRRRSRSGKRSRSRSGKRSRSRSKQPKRQVTYKTIFRLASRLEKLLDGLLGVLGGFWRKFPEGGLDFLEVALVWKFPHRFLPK